MRPNHLDNTRISNLALTTKEIASVLERMENEQASGTSEERE
jgi:hypothetical protein